MRNEFICDCDCKLERAVQGSVTREAEQASPPANALGNKTAVESDARSVALIKTYRAGKELDFEIVQTHLLSYQTKQAFDLAICTMVLTFLPDSQIADAIEKLQSMTSIIARKTSSNDV
jgi:hypothetical protein